jgi:hypothetical protein
VGNQATGKQTNYSTNPYGSPKKGLAAMPRALVGDVAHVVRVDTLRETPLVVHGPTKAKPALD